MHPTWIRNRFNIQSKCVQKMSRCTLHGGPFSVQRTTFLVQRSLFLRPLDEGRPQSAKKVSALDAFGSPVASLSGPKVRRNRLGSLKRIQKSGKGHPKIDAKNMPEKTTKCIPKAFQNDAKTDTKIIELLYFCEKGWNAPNCLFSNRKRGSGHPKIEKSTSKMSAKSMFEQNMQKEIKK